MKILFINPPISLKKRFPKILGGLATTFSPIGLAYMAALLEKNSFHVDILDMCVEEGGYSLLEEKLSKKPDIVGLQVLTPTFKEAIKLANFIKSKLPKSKIVIGGAHASLFPKEILKEEKNIDFVIFGEGEFTFLELANTIKKKKHNFKKIKGLAFKKERKIFVTEPRPPIKDLDSLPFPARHLLNLDKYTFSPVIYKKKPLAAVLGSRGCPYKCTFCSKAVFGDIRRVRSVKNVIGEIKELKNKYNVKEIIFIDDLFTFNKKWVKELCEELIKINMVWSCQTCIFLIDEEILKLMKKAGCWNIFYGFESGNQDILDSLKKGTTLEQIRKGVHLTQKAGIEIRAAFMIGLPNETPEKTLKTIQFAKELDCEYTTFNIFCPFPGTKIYEEIQKGKLEYDIDKFTTQHALYLPKGYKNREEVFKMKGKAYRMIYLRPSFMFKRLLKIRSFEDLKRCFRGFLALLI